MLWWYSNATCFLYKFGPDSGGISHIPETVESPWIHCSESSIKSSRTLRSAS